ncbi:hypothetical protein ATKI12_1190 [Kitasatospora sp. Ki12]
MRLRAELHCVRLGRDEYRVITPVWQSDGTCLYASPDGWFMELQVDPQGAGDLATVCALAARSRHSLVHLPLRAGTHGGWGSGRPAKGVPGSLHITCAPGRSVG